MKLEFSLKFLHSGGRGSSKAKEERHIIDKIKLGRPQEKEFEDLSGGLG